MTSRGSRYAGTRRASRTTCSSTRSTPRCGSRWRRASARLRSCPRSSPAGSFARCAQVRDATRRLANGHYDERVAEPGELELAELARDVNRLAVELETTERRRARLVSEVAHEMRTPLTTIDGYVEGMLDGVFEPSEEVLVAVGEETSRLQRLASDLAELSRSEEGATELHLRVVDLGELAASSAERLRPQFDEKGVSLSVAAGPPLPVEVDPDRIAQVLTNLFGNALTYTPAGGRVEVRASRERDGGDHHRERHGHRPVARGPRARLRPLLPGARPGAPGGRQRHRADDRPGARPGASRRHRGRVPRCRRRFGLHPHAPDGPPGATRRRRDPSRHLHPAGRAGFTPRGVGWCHEQRRADRRSDGNHGARDRDRRADPVSPIGRSSGSRSWRLAGAGSGRDSEISRLNERAGVPVLVSQDTYQLIERAVEGWRLTEGRFDPTLLHEVRAAGYDRSFELIGSPDAPRDSCVTGRQHRLRAVASERAGPDADPARPDRRLGVRSGPRSRSTRAVSGRGSPRISSSSSCSPKVRAAPW